MSRIYCAAHEAGRGSLAGDGWVQGLHGPQLSQLVQEGNHLQGGVGRRAGKQVEQDKISGQPACSSTVACSAMQPYSTARTPPKPKPNHRHTQT